MIRSIDEISHLVSAWILGEKDEWRKMAYIIANTYRADVELRDYLLGLLQGGDSPGIRGLKADLGDMGMDVLKGKTLPWTRVWSYVGVDLVGYVGAELKPGEHAELRAKLEEKEARR